MIPTVSMLAMVARSRSAAESPRRYRSPARLPAKEAAHRALTAEEEAYAAALWPLHSEVKLAAVRMTFAGIAYRTEDHDPEQLAAKVRPLGGDLEAVVRDSGRGDVIVVRAPAGGDSCLAWQVVPEDDRYLLGVVPPVDGC